MKKNKTINYIKETFSNFVDSFRNLDKTILYVVVYNFVLYISSYAVFRKMLDSFMDKAAPIFDIATQNAYGASDVILQNQVGIIRTFRHAFWSHGVSFLVIIFLIYTLINLIVWAAITNKKLKRSRFELNFFGLNLMWVAGTAIIVYFFSSSFKPESIAIGLFILMLIYSHLTTILYIAYFKKKKIGKSVKSAFNTGFAKLHHFILPYAFAAAIFIILNAILMPIGNSLRQHSNTIFFITFLFYFAWLRIYIYSFAKKLA